MPVPMIWKNFEAESVGQVPEGWLYPATHRCLVSNQIARETRSLDCSAANFPSNEYFPRMTVDLGENIGTNVTLYFTFWMFLSDPGTQICWKGPLLTSSLTPNYWAGAGTATTNNATGIGSWWNPTTSRWFNTAVTVQYSQNTTAAFNYCSSGNGSAADSFLFGTWQRLEYTLRTSSTPGAQDGSVKVERVGKTSPTTNATGCLTHGDTSDPWRFFSIPQGVTNIASLPFNMSFVFDDLYIAKGLARVELCDTSDWNSRGHCEIQKVIAWSPTEISAQLNYGSFSQGQTAYFHVIDSAGVSHLVGGSLVVP